MRSFATRRIHVFALLAFVLGTVSTVMAADEKGLLRNETCPITGKPTDPKFFAEFKDENKKVNARIYFATAEAAEQAKKGDLKELYTKAYLTKADGTKTEYGKTAHDLMNEKCVGTGEATDLKEGAFVNFNGTKVHICCDSCEGDLLKDPDKTLAKHVDDIKKMKEAEKKAEKK